MWKCERCGDSRLSAGQVVGNVKDLHFLLTIHYSALTIHN